VNAPVAGAAGSAWRTATAPFRVSAPAISAFRRVLRSEFWVETEKRTPGTGPEVEMSAMRSDIQRPRDGAGPLNHRTYRVHIESAARTPEEIVAAFRRKPNDFSPTSFATFDPPLGPDGMTVGDQVTIRLPGPWDGPVVVSEVGPGMVKLETLETHMEAGWICFTATLDEHELTFEIESFARSGDPLFDALYHPGRVGRFVQTEMWVRVLEAVVAFSGGKPIGRVIVDTTIYEGQDK